MNLPFARHTLAFLVGCLDLSSPCHCVVAHWGRAILQPLTNTTAHRCVARTDTSSLGPSDFGRALLLFRKTPLVIEQPFLSPEAAAITAERTVGADDAMTGDDDGEHVRSV